MAEAMPVARFSCKVVGYTGETAPLRKVKIMELVSVAR